MQILKLLEMFSLISELMDAVQEQKDHVLKMLLTFTQYPISVPIITYRTQQIFLYVNVVQTPMKTLKPQNRAVPLWNRMDVKLFHVPRISLIFE